MEKAARMMDHQHQGYNLLATGNSSQKVFVRLGTTSALQNLLAALVSVMLQH